VGRQRQVVGDFFEEDQLLGGEVMGIVDVQYLVK
jgi:hypothetical protein